MTETPPKGLGWAATSVARTLALSLAIVSLMISGYTGWRYLGLVDCLAEQALTGQQRTSALASATDAERAADMRLLQGGGDVENLRRDAIAARLYTDKVRAAHPAPPVKRCG